jgi:hypothetical protein
MSKGVVEKVLMMFLFLVSIFGIYAEGAKSITIKHIGAQDVPYYPIIINTQKQGLDYDLDRDIWFLFYYIVDDIMFEEIIDLFNNNSELFGEREWLLEYNEFRIYASGTFEILIENERAEYYCYLIERKKSALFFSKLIALLESKENNNELINKLNNLFDFFHFGRAIVADTEKP